MHDTPDTPGAATRPDRTSADAASEEAARPRPRPMIAADASANGPTSHAVALLLCAAGLAASLACGLRHPNGIVHFDDLTHYLYARWAWTWPAYLLDDWGRPGFTAAYFLPARLGWDACRALSAVLSSAAAFFAYLVASNLGLRRAWAVIPLAYLQPLYFQLSQTTLTETPTAFYLVLAVWLAQRSHWTASAAVVSLTFVTRHEAVVLLPVWLAAARQAKVPLRWLWPIAWAPVVVNLLAPFADMRPAVAQFLDPTRAGQYGRGGWLTFLSRSLEAWGPAVAILALIGLVEAGHGSGEQEKGGGKAGTNRGANRLVTLSIVVYFAAQTVVRAMGLYDSGGYARFLVPLSPLIAVAALAGWNRLISAEPAERQRALILIALAMLLLWAAMERQLVLHAARADEAAEVPELHKAVFAMRVVTAVVVGLAILLAAIPTGRDSLRKGTGSRERGTGDSRTGSEGSGADDGAASGVSALLRQGRAGLSAPSAGAARRESGVGAGLLRLAMPAALVALMGLAAYALCGPLKPPPEDRLIAEARKRLAEVGLGDRDVLSANVWIDYVTGRAQPPWRRPVREQLRTAAIGTLFAWERQFAGSLDHGIALDDLAKDPGMRLVLVTPALPYQTSPYLTIFEKVADWPKEVRDAAVSNHAPRP